MSLLDKIADKYDPSVAGAIGMVTGLVIMGTAVAAPVCFLAGASIAKIFGIAATTGGLWGGGIVVGAAALVSSCMIVPHAVKTWCYKHQLKKRVAAGEDVTGCWTVPGIEKIVPRYRHGEPLSGIFTRAVKDADADNGATPGSAPSRSGPQQSKPG